MQIVHFILHQVGVILHLLSVRWTLSNLQCMYEFEPWLQIFPKIYFTVLPEWNHPCNLSGPCNHIIERWKTYFHKDLFTKKWGQRLNRIKRGKVMLRTIPIAFIFYNTVSFFSLFECLSLKMFLLAILTTNEWMVSWWECYRIGSKINPLYTDAVSTSLIWL